MSTLAFSAGGVTVPTLGASVAMPGSSQVVQFALSGSGTVAARFRLYGAHDGPFKQIGPDFSVVGTDVASMFFDFPYPIPTVWHVKAEVVEIIGSGATAQVYLDGQ